MDNLEYIERLKKKLRSLPPNELEDALQYYREYFDEAGPENEQKAIEELGSPEKAAAMIKANHAMRDMEKSKGSAKKSIKTVFIVILAVFASPVAIPIAVAIFAVMISIVVSLLAFFVSLFAAGIGAAAGGFLTFIAALFIIVESPATALLYAGLGMACASVGVALIIATAFICKVSFRAIANMMSKYVLGRRSK